MVVQNSLHRVTFSKTMDCDGWELNVFFLLMCGVLVVWLVWSGFVAKLIWCIKVHLPQKLDDFFFMILISEIYEQNTNEECSVIKLDI